MAKVQVLLAVLVMAALVAGVACAQPAPAPTPSAPKPTASPAPAAPPKASPTPAASPAPAPKTETDVWPKVVNIGSKSAGSATYIMAVAMFKVIEAATGHKASPLPMATSAAFSQSLEDKKIEFSIAGAPNFRWSLEGRTTKDKKPLTTLRTIASGSPLQYILAVRPDSGINKLADIKGKTIIGKQAGSDMVAAAWPCILAAAGLTEKDVTFLPFTATSEIKDAINEKRAQGEIWWTNSASTYVKELATAGDIKFISLTDEEIKRAVAKEPAFVPTVLAAGTFKGQDKPVKSFGMYTDIATRTTLADEVVYAVTAAIHDRFSDLVSYSPEFKLYALPDSIAPDKLIVPVHNGAIKYFKERGFWKKAHEDRQAQLLKELNLK